jgi:hypothetical protein
LKNKATQQFITTEAVVAQALENVLKKDPDAQIDSGLVMTKVQELDREFLAWCDAYSPILSQEIRETRKRIQEVLESG